jgi:hypothetical protein
MTSPFIRERLRTLIKAVLQQHRDTATAIDELTYALDDEIEACVCDRVNDLIEWSLDEEIRRRLLEKERTPKQN